MRVYTPETEEIGIPLHKERDGNLESGSGSDSEREGHRGRQSCERGWLSNMAQQPKVSGCLEQILNSYNAPASGRHTSVKVASGVPPETKWWKQLDG